MQAWTDSSLRERAVLLQRTRWSYRGDAECRKGQRSTGINPHSFSISIPVTTPHGKVNWKCSVLQLCFHTNFLPSKASTGGNTSLLLQGQKSLTVREGTKVGLARNHDIYCTEIKGMTNTCNTALLWRYSMQPEERHTN